MNEDPYTDAIVAALDICIQEVADAKDREIASLKTAMSHLLAIATDSDIKCLCYINEPCVRCKMIRAAQEELNKPLPPTTT